MILMFRIVNIQANMSSFSALSCMYVINYVQFLAIWFKIMVNIFKVTTSGDFCQKLLEFQTIGQCQLLHRFLGFLFFRCFLPRYTRTQKICYNGALESAIHTSQLTYVHIPRYLLCCRKFSNLFENCSTPSKRNSILK